MQKMFDKVVANLRSMPHRSMMADNQGCAYRSYDGLKCAVGCLIPDSLYTPIIEGISIPNIGEGYTKKLSKWHSKLSIQDICLLGSLQNLHDGPENWGKDGFIAEADLLQIAVGFKLEYHAP